MSEDELLEAVRRRAADPRTRTDYADRRAREVAAPAPPESVVAVEIAMGCPLHALHGRVLTEIGNGGFGPGDGLFGVAGGRLDEDGRSLLELREVLWGGAGAAGLPPGVLPLCDWGDAIWSCLDERTGHVLTLDESGLTDTGRSLHEWLGDWASGADLFASMFTFEQRAMTNPFTGQRITVRSPVCALGTPYRPEGREPERTEHSEGSCARRETLP